MTRLQEITGRTAREINATKTEIDLFISRLDRFLNKNLRKILADILSNNVRGLEAATILGGIESALIEAGLQEQLAGIERIYGNKLKDVRTQLRTNGFAGEVLTAEDFQLAETLITFDTTKVANRITEYVDDVSTTLMRGVILGEVSDFSVIQSDFGDSLISDLESEMSTLTSGFYQTVVGKKADDLGLNLYLYVGPEDAVTRKFCQQVLDGSPEGVSSRKVPIYSREEIDSMDNGQGLPVFPYRGGYRCRHQWTPVSAELAKELGYNKK